VVGVTACRQDPPVDRITLTPPAIVSARQVIFLVSGPAKAEIVQAVLEGPGSRFPAQKIQPTSGKLAWLLDAAAAQRLKEKGSSGPRRLVQDAPAETDRWTDYTRLAIGRGI
jgi:6-phosphogluconolactonase/glucosamine-6-phosphate isomerase/deaminase